MEDNQLHDALYGDATPAASGTPEPSPAPEGGPAVEAQPASTEATAPPATTGEEGQTGQQPEPSSSRVEDGLEAALAAERKARQAAELEAARLRGYHEGQTASLEPGEPVQEPSFWEDPEGSIDRAVAKGRAAEKAERFDVSVENAMAKYSDWEDLLGEFQVMVQKDPRLGANLNRQLDPAEWAAQQVFARREAEKRAAEAATFDPEKERERIREEERARLRAEMGIEGDQGKGPRSVATIPTSNAGAMGVGTSAPIGGGIADEDLLSTALKGAPLQPH